jgi:hypothetical protein
MRRAIVLSIGTSASTLAFIACNGLIGAEEATLRTDGGVGNDAGDGAASTIDGNTIVDGALLDGAPQLDGPVGPFTCTPGAAVQVSSGTDATGPTLAFHPAGAGSPAAWGVAWRRPPDIRYVPLSLTGTRLIDAGAELVLATGDLDSRPRLAATSAGFVLAYGTFATGSAGVTTFPFDVLTAVGTPEPGPTASGVGPSIVSGIAMGTDTAYVASRTFTTNALVAHRLETYVPTFSNEASGPVSGSPAIAISGTTVAVAYADTSVGHIQSYTAPSLTPGVKSPFTGAGALPQAGDPAYELGITTAGDRFAVVWLDRRDAGFDVFVSTVPIAGGTVLGEVLVRKATTQVAYPRIVFDGTSIVVSWLENIPGQPSYFDVRARRYTPALAPLETDSTCVTCGVLGNRPKTAMGAAFATKNDYGFAFMNEGPPSRETFVRMLCTGP